MPKSLTAAPTMFLRRLPSRESENGGERGFRTFTVGETSIAVAAWFMLPENLYPEFLPEPIKIKSKFGEYEAGFKFDAGKVVYVRRMKVWKGRFAKETYNELIDFYKSANKADNIKLVFLSKT